MERDQRLTGIFRGQSDVPDAPLGFDGQYSPKMRALLLILPIVNSQWKVCCVFYYSDPDLINFPRAKNASFKADFNGPSTVSALRLYIRKTRTASMNARNDHPHHTPICHRIRINVLELIAQPANALDSRRLSLRLFIVSMAFVEVCAPLCCLLCLLWRCSSSASPA